MTAPTSRLPIRSAWRRACRCWRPPAGRSRACATACRTSRRKAGSRTTSRDRNCGNGVVIRHADGWETQYCHLRRGSVQVAEGDRVEAGEPLGLVGMSGEANFPHVHLSVRRDGDRHRPVHR